MSTWRYPRSPWSQRRWSRGIDSTPREGTIKHAHQLTNSYVKDSIELFRYYKKLAERAIEQCPDEGLFAGLDHESNCIAVVVKHMSGNMRSRWSDFLTTDGEKPDRHRDSESEQPRNTRQESLALGAHGWKYLFDALEWLSDEDLTPTGPCAPHLIP